MPSCCYGDEYGSVFSPAEAAAMRRRFERRGLTGTRADTVALLAPGEVEGASVLEVGAGIGDLLVTLLERGSAHATNVDLSPHSVASSWELATARGVSDRFEARSGDFVDLAPALERADLVVLHRVVCCYPDWRALLAASADRSRRLVVLTYPVDAWWSRGALSLANLYFRLRGLRFRVFVHPERAMTQHLAGLGFAPNAARRRGVWRTIAFRRT
jgi:SAM-dependent methyltransferase